MRVEIEDKVNECLKRAKSYYKQDFPFPDIDFSLRGVSSGRCRSYNMFSSFTLSFNLDLANNNPDDFLNNTVPHEVAHMVSRILYSMQGTGHGRKWKSVMYHCFNVMPKRCHNYDVSETKRKTHYYEYSCLCRNHEFSIRRHNKIRKGALYSCKLCKGNLQYNKYIGVK